jgi:DNA-binding response OmpR family regulator
MFWPGKGKTVISRRLLVVDDDPAMGDFVRDIATPLGFAVETFIEAKGFKAAVAKGDPDVIILDLTMPKIDGIELIGYLAEKKSHAKIFIMSGFDPAVQRMAKTLGEGWGLDMADIIPKPVRAARFREILMRQNVTLNDS